MKSPRVLALIKFGQREHINAFVRGQLYMNPLSYFVELEQDSLRRDLREGQSLWMQSSRMILQVKMEGEFRRIPGITGVIGMGSKGNLKANVFCMYALRSANTEDLVDSRNLDFGDTFAVVTDGDEFIRRVRAGAEREGRELQLGLVRYVDEKTYEGPVGIFRKSSVYSYQSECRFALIPGAGSPYVLDVCDLTDIVATGPSQELENRIRLVQA